MMSDLAEKIKEEYNQCQDGDSLSLFLDGFLLPPWEPIKILKNGDLVKVMRKTGAQKRKRGASKTPTKTAEEEEKPPTKKHKKTSATPVIKTVIPAKTSSSSSSESSSEEEESKKNRKPV